MKKLLAVFLMIAMLATAVAAVAEGGRGGQPLMGGKMQQGPRQGGQPGGGKGGQPGGQRPQDAPQQPGGEQPENAPQHPDGQQPPQGGQGPKDGPGMIDFDAMVQDGVISEATRDNIRAWMEAHRPEDGAQPGEAQKPEGEAPADGGQPEDAPEQPDLLADLLEAGVITQAEYDAMTAATQAE